MISMLASSERLNGCLFRHLINVLSNSTHENWSDVYVIHPKVILDDSQERITTASYVFQSHSAKEERVALLSQPNPSKMKLYYTISDPGLFITCFFISGQEKLISFDEDI